MEIAKAGLLTIGLSTDVFVASISTGLMIRCLTKKRLIGISFVYAWIQSLFALLAYQLLENIGEMIRYFDHLISFIILAVIGITMLIRSYRDTEYDQRESKLKWSVISLIGIAVATDILTICNSDTFVNIGLLGTPIILIETFLFSLIGIIIGHKLGVKYRYKCEFSAGVLLIILALKLCIIGIFRR